MKTPCFDRALAYALLAAAGLLLPVLPAGATLVDLAAPTTAWTPIMYSNNNPDPSNDQQTGSTEGDIVGNAAHPSVYTMFGDAGTPSLTDGTLAFRIRLGEDSAPGGFKTALFIYIDANADGKIDLFLGVNNAGSADSIGIWGAGATLNISPSTTSISNTPLVSYPTDANNYYWSQVTTVNDPSVGSATDLDGGGEFDFFLGFSIPFADVVNQLSLLGISGFNQDSTLTYVIATATQANSLNQDLNGVDKNFDGSLTWSQLGVLSSPMTPAGMVVPEVNSAVWVFLLLGAVVAQRWFVKRNAPKRQRVPADRA